jgi:saccharopine dehydrogenase-like NADP-dependent oxidoreductase
MKEIVVIGAGKIGATVADLLASMDEYQITLADRSPEVLGRIDRNERIRVATADVEDSSKLVDVLNGQFAVINAGPFHLTTIIAEAARAARTHYLDLTEDVASMRRVRELAAGASTAFIPQCGLAPGFVSIVAFDMTKRFEVLDSLKLRVGALPQYPSNALNYNLTWSTDGVINRRSTPQAGSGRFVIPLRGRSVLSITVQSVIRAMQPLCALSSMICACAIDGMC